MRQVRIRELALVAVAGGLLAFEVVGLKGVLPVAMAALEQHGILNGANVATASAAGAAANVLTAASPTATRAAVGLAKEAAGIHEDRDAGKVASQRVARAVQRDVHAQHYYYVIAKTDQGPCLVKSSSCERCRSVAVQRQRVERRAAAIKAAALARARAAAEVEASL